MSEQASSIQAAGGGFEIKENPTIKELLDRAATELSESKIEQKFPGAPEVHCAILQTVGNTYHSIGEFEKAISFLERSKTTAENLFDDSTETRQNIELQLAIALRDDGQLMRAIAMLEKVSDIRSKTLGRNHRDTLKSQSQLALAYRKTSRLVESIEMVERVVQSQKETLGNEHPETLASNHEIVWLRYLKTGDSLAAISDFEELIKTETRILGSDNPITLSSRGCLALISMDTDRIRALVLVQESYDAYLQTLGPFHPDTLNAKHNLAVCHKLNGNDSAAIALFQDVLKDKTQRFGPDHPTVLVTLSYLGKALWDNGERKRGIELYTQAALSEERRSFRDEFGNHFVRGLIKLLEEAGRWNDAEDWWKRWLAPLRARTPKNQQRIALNLLGLGNNFVEQHKWEEAENVLRECLVICSSIDAVNQLIFAGLPSMHIANICKAKGLLGEALAGLGQHQEAEALMLAAYHELAENPAVINTKGIETVRSIRRLIRFYESVGRSSSAEEWRQNAMLKAN